MTGAIAEIENGISKRSTRGQDDTGVGPPDWMLSDNLSPASIGIAGMHERELRQ
jgi:hypothetical protein